MLIRALVVLLLVLNLGVALWWAMRPSALPNVQPTAPAAGVERLQLASEATAGKPEAPRTPDPTAAAVSQCVSLGPYADAALAEQARRALQPLAVRVALRREYTGTPRNWKVFLPPASTIQQAEAAAARVAGAGFKDYFVVRDGADARSLALGLYGNETAARERLATLVAAGFEAELAPVGAGPAMHWVDVAAGPGFDPAAARTRIDAQRVEPVDCERLTAVARAGAR